MTNTDKLRAMLAGAQPDRVPVWLFSELVPQGLFERELRPRGVGLIKHFSSVRQHVDEVEYDERDEGGVYTLTARTPVGALQSRYHSHRDGLSGNGMVQFEWFVKGPEDYPAMIHILEHTRFSVDELAYPAFLRDADGAISHTWCDEPPYMGLQYLLGYEAWVMHQADWPDAFDALLEAYGAMQERRIAAQLSAPERDLINIGNLAGNFSPAAYARHMKPYFDRQARRLREAGASVTIHADATNLSLFLKVFPGEFVNVVEAFTPPPVGDLGLADARAAFGPDVLVHIHVPESLFLLGPGAVREWTTALIDSDRGGRRFLSFTELGFLGASGGALGVMLDGMHAMLDVVERAGY